MLPLRPGRAVLSGPVLSRPVLSHPFLVPAAQGAIFLRVAAQGAPGDPRLPSRHKALASQAPPSRGWHVASCHPAPFFVWRARVLPSCVWQPRVPPSCVWRARVPPATPACPPGTRLSLRRHPLAGGGMSPHATLPRLPHEPRGKGSPFMDNREAADLVGDHTLSYFGGH